MSTPTTLFLRRAAIWASATALLTGCAFNAPPPVELGSATQPLTAGQLTPPPPAVGTATTGSLFNAQTYRPGFENRRARLVGDIVTIVIAENVTARQQQNSAVSRSNSIETEVSAVPFINSASLLGKLGAGVDSESAFSGGGNTTSNNSFSGTITATVKEVMPNGHLVVTGEKQVGVNHNVDLLRFTGTVDPYMLQPNSTIYSTQVANVRVESRSRGQQGAAQSIGWLSSFFLNFLPF